MDKPLYMVSAMLYNVASRERIWCGEPGVTGQGT